MPEETEEESARAAIVVAALALSLCPVFAVLVVRHRFCLTLRNLDPSFAFPLATLLNSDCSFRSLSFALSVLSRVAPKLSLSTRPQRYRLSGVSDKAIQAPLPGGLAYTPDNLWLNANG